MVGGVVNVVNAADIWLQAALAVIDEPEAAVSVVPLAGSAIAVERLEVGQT